MGSALNLDHFEITFAQILLELFSVVLEGTMQAKI